MGEAGKIYDQYFLSYSGAKLPLNLVGPLETAEVENRNTCFAANLDAAGRVNLIHKLVYGAVEMSHLYGYDGDGNLAWAEIRTIDDEARKLWFSPEGQVIRDEDLDE